MGGSSSASGVPRVIRSPPTMLSPLIIRTYSPSRIEPLPIRYRTSSTSSGGQFDDHGISITGRHLTCHWSFTQPRPQPIADLCLSARVVQSPGARNPHRVQRVGRLRWSDAGQSLQGSGNRGRVGPRGVVQHPPPASGACHADTCRSIQISGLA